MRRKRRFLQARANSFPEKMYHQNATIIQQAAIETQKNNNRKIEQNNKHGTKETHHVNTHPTIIEMSDCRTYSFACKKHTKTIVFSTISMGSHQTRKHLCTQSPNANFVVTDDRLADTLKSSPLQGLKSSQAC